MAQRGDAGSSLRATSSGNAETGAGSGGSAKVKRQNESLEKLMECPICIDIVTPVYQCLNGHIICEKCWDNLSAVKSCPACRVSMVKPMRNRQLETIIENYEGELACRYSYNGCQARMLFSTKEAHQATCRFKGFDCPLSAMACDWVGEIGDIVPHLMEHEPNVDSATVYYGDSVKISFPVALVEAEGFQHTAIKVLSTMDECFLLFFRINFLGFIPNTMKLNVEYSTLVQFVGSCEQAKKFAYRIELERDEKRLSWEAVPLSIKDSVEKAIDSGDCLSFSNRVMRQFKIGVGDRNNSILEFGVTISEL